MTHKGRRTRTEKLYIDLKIVYVILGIILIFMVLNAMGFFNDMITNINNFFTEVIP